jgi:hypothetical protein
MAVKRKIRKARVNSIARMKPRRSEAAAKSNSTEIPEDLLDHAALPESEASGVMLVITIASLIFIGFIAWCVAQMPAK